MSLLEQQNFLARLYTDENLRRSFLTDAGKTGKENSLTEKETEELAAILPEELQFFSDSLFWKRLREAEKFLPLTRKVLAGNFEMHFRVFSAGFNPKSVKKHLEDAVEFCSFLQNCEIDPHWVKDLIRFERARLIFNSGSKIFVIKKFNYDIKQILKEVSRKEAREMKGDLLKKRTFAVWMRAGRRVKHLIF